MHEINHHVIKDHFKDLSERNFFEERTTRFLHSNKPHSYIARILTKFSLLCIFEKGWRRQWHPTPLFLPGKSHGRRSLVGCSPWGRKESDTTERLHFHSSLSCVGEGNGNPLQCSCLENPRDGGAWWAAVYGVAQSRTRLKQLSSSSSSSAFGTACFAHSLISGDISVCDH